MMSPAPIIIYQAASLHQAHLLQQMLERVGIEAWVEAPHDQHFGQSSHTAAPRVLVRPEDREEARQIAQEFEQLLQLPSQAEEPEPPATKQAGETVDAWPRCPRCEQPRNAECLLCGEARDFFPAAYQHDGESNGLYFCTSCDDVAELQFYRHCHQCGHDYGAGREPVTLPRAEDERRGWQVLWAMLAGAALIIGYFAWLFRR